MPRFIVLEHAGAPDDPAGVHYDLLLEDGPACRTWRLAALPEPGNAPVDATELSPHRLAWLDHEAGEVSGGRGFARRIDAGTYEPAARDAGGAHPGATIDVMLRGDRIQGEFVLRVHAGRWLARRP